MAVDAQLAAQVQAVGFTVRTEVPMSAAISLLERPSEIHCSTLASRGVRARRGPDALPSSSATGCRPGLKYRPPA